MANQSSWDISQSTIAVVIQPPVSPPNFEESDLRSLLRPPYSIGQASAGESILSSARDQVEVIFTPSKINVRDLSGKDNFDDSRVPEILHLFVYKYGTLIRSFGINFVILIENPDPQRWIRKVLLNPSLEAKSGFSLLGGQARVSLQSGPKTWNIGFQQIQEENVLELNFNSSEMASELSPIVELQRSMNDQLDKLRELMRKLMPIEVKENG